MSDDTEKPATESLAPKEEFHALAERARQGDRSVLPELRALLDSHPEIWHRYGDLAAHAQDAWIRLSAGTNVGLRESLNRKVAALRAELAGPAPSMLERLLSERAVANWLQVHHAEAAVAQARTDTPLKVMDYLEKRHERAHRRYLQSLGALVTVRRLLPSAAGREQIQAHAAVAERVIEVDPKGVAEGADHLSSDVSAAIPGSPTTSSVPDPPLALYDPLRDRA